MKSKPKQNGQACPKADRVTVRCKRMVVLDEAAYNELLRKADLWEPELPQPDKDGNYPALDALAVLQARDILREQRKWR